MAKLRGSKESYLKAIAETLRVVLKEDDTAELRAGILAVVHSIEAKIKNGKKELVTPNH